MQTNQNLPFRFQEVFKLTTLGLDPALFKFGNLTFESQKYICVKDGGVSNFTDQKKPRILFNMIL